MNRRTRDLLRTIEDAREEAKEFETARKVSLIGSTIGVLLSTPSVFIGAETGSPSAWVTLTIGAMFLALGVFVFAISSDELDKRKKRIKFYERKYADAIEDGEL